MDNLKTYEEYFNEAKKWIKDAIKEPGALRKTLGLKKDQKLTKTSINQELSKLRGKDRDKSKPGVQLGPRDAKKYKRLNLAKTLAKFNESKEIENYMFFQNLVSLKNMAASILKMNQAEIDKLLSDGHGWAVDHIATSKDDVEEVYQFLSADNPKEKTAEVIQPGE